MKYYASFSANNGTTFNTESYIYSSKKEAIKNIKEICKGAHFAQMFNTSSVSVMDENENTVYSATISDFSDRFYKSNY